MEERLSKDMLWIFIAVLSAHAVLIIWLSFYHPEIKISQKQNKLVVKTVKLENKKLLALNEPPPAPAPKIETPKVETPKIETPKIETPKVETPKVETPKVETPKVETPKIETPKVQTPKPAPVKKIEKTPAKKEAPKVRPDTKKPAPPAKPAPKPAAQKKPAPAQPETKTLAQTQKLAEQKRHESLSKAKESLAKLSKKPIESSHAKSDAISVPSAIGSLHTDAAIENKPSMSPKETRYHDELVSRLKLSLKMPELGTVKVRLTLLRSGKIEKFEILSSSNKKNQDKIEKELGSLTLPPFGDNFIGEASHTFTLTLSSQ